MSMVRRILNLLPNDSLVDLQKRRDIGPRRNAEDRRQGFARSYRGNVEDLLNDVSREDLILLLDRTFHCNWNRYFPPGLSRSRGDLQAWAVSLFAHREIPEEFTCEDVSEIFYLTEDSLEEDSADAEDDATASEEDDAGEDEQSNTQSGSSDSDSAFVASLSSEWSRPRKLVALMNRDLDIEVNERLRTERFQEAVQRLRELGVEACDADTDEVFTVDSLSPGIHAKVRLRLLPGQQSLGLVKDVPSLPAQPSAEPLRPVVFGHSDSGRVATISAAADGVPGLVHCLVFEGEPSLSIDGEKSPALEELVRRTYAHVLSALPVYGTDPVQMDRVRLVLRFNNYRAFDVDAEADVSIGVAMLSAIWGRPCSDTIAVVGELSRQGRLLTSDFLAERLSRHASARLSTVIVPEDSMEELSDPHPTSELELLPAATLLDAAELLLAPATPVKAAG